MAKAKPCVVCKGSGKCRHCQGRGLVLKHAGAPSVRCLECGGSGICPACHGEDVKTDDKGSAHRAADAKRKK